MGMSGVSDNLVWYLIVVTASTPNDHSKSKGFKHATAGRYISKACRLRIADSCDRLFVDNT
eukprot:m.48266 g.48266  ORF g.48266 m.48266 type:complete len:61 (-) comp13276_c0_seq11:142-324(-)